MTEANAAADRGSAPRQSLLRLLLFSLSSNAAVLLTFWIGLFFWPEGLPGNTQNVFWLASGVNTAGLLLLGIRYWPLLLVNALPAWLLIPGATLPGCLFGALCNALEALFGAWFILRVGKFEGGFGSLRSVGALAIASLLAPLANTIIMPLYLCMEGIISWQDYGHALANWNLSNGAALLILTPLLVALMRQDWSGGRRVSERLLAALAAAGLSFIAFNALFGGAGMNLAFLAFPAVIYTGVRFGSGETALALGITLLSVYAALRVHASAVPVEQVPQLLWFTQAIIWVLAATGLLVAALGAERRRAEHNSLEAFLGAEKARLAALRYQINPHFLFNTLNSIRASLPLSEQPGRQMITSLSVYLRSSLEGGEVTAVPLSEEMESVREYLRIEGYRFGARLQTQFDVCPLAGAATVPGFILQPLAENAIRHGLETSPQTCRIAISAQVAEGRVQLKVSNTGKWRTPDTGGGIGLSNVRRRLELTYGDRASLCIEHPDDCVCVTIVLPR